MFLLGCIMAVTPAIGRRAFRHSASGISALINDERVDEQPTTKPVDLAYTPKRRRADHGGGEPQIGRALRSVYDQTVGEAIPPEMLALLGKLG